LKLLLNISCLGVAKVFSCSHGLGFVTPWSCWKLQTNVVTFLDWYI